MCGMTDHMGDLRRRLQAIEDRSAAEHQRKVRVIAVGLVVIAVAAIGLWWAFDQRQTSQGRSVCEITQTQTGMTPAEARDYCY